MRRLSEVIAEQTNDELVLAREFIGFIVVPGADRGETNPTWVRENGKVYQRVTVQVALERTAVVYVDVVSKFLVKLEAVFVQDSAIRWLPMNPTELREKRSREIGHARSLIHAKPPQ